MLFLSLQWWAICSYTYSSQHRPCFCYAGLEIWTELIFNSLNKKVNRVNIYYHPFNCFAHDCPLKILFSKWHFCFKFYDGVWFVSRKESAVVGCDAESDAGTVLEGDRRHVDLLVFSMGLCEVYLLETLLKECWTVGLWSVLVWKCIVCWAVSLLGSEMH